MNYKRHTARYRARRRAADILYEAENRDVDPVAIVEDRVALAREDRHAVAPIADYTKVIVQGVAEELDAIDDTISRYLSQNWELHRIPAVDRAILRLSVWELLFNPDVPTATAVVEGVELASQYSHDQAAPYIHAVLDDVAQSRSELSPMNNVGQEEESDDAEAEDSEDSQEDSAPSTHAETPEESGEASPSAETEADNS
ncbi:transcription antitermination factor NusB [Corynebacterium sp. KPL2861]|uniref:transcription antitermination factor NusB n=1 Tax=unclassified Corynebacterium TaxID=2624378 RepID=UPI0032EF3F95